jgi:Di-haem oxidoreductase, putative peroxidase
MPMFCKKNLFLQGVRVVMALSTLMLLANVLQAQTDPGPRPVGNASRSVCPIPSAKFPGDPPCIDNVQPPDSRGGDGAGNIIGNAGNLAGFWFEALTVFETPAVVGPGPQTGGSSIPGLGPSFNAVSCFQCHSQPTVGGSSPNTKTPGFPNGNPQVGDAPTATQLNNVSSFISANGPVREARFPRAVAGSGNRAAVSAGAVAELFVIQGRPDAPANCAIDQEDFPTQVANNNIIFRIPIPTFGEGFVENTPDNNLVADLAQEDAIANNTNIFNPPLGIKGSFNHNGNDQTISRFGWKAQNKSMLLFAGEAFNVEMGVTNELFQNERTIGNNQCAPNPEPEDQVVVPPTSFDSRTITTLLNSFGPSGVASDISNDIENFAVFMRLNAAPSVCNFNSGLDSSGAAQCLALNASSQRGQALFGSLDPTVAGSFTSPSPSTTGIKSIGCVLCHSDFLTTTTSSAPSLNNASFHPFSDFALHTMDSSLADGVTQGEAGSAQFRSAPLWGIGQRLFFLHDGRASDVLKAILDHAPNAGTSPANCTPAMGEACQVIVLFNNLPPTSGTTGTPSQQDILNFLRSL